jgi:hypothetical protein
MGNLPKCCCSINYDGNKNENKIKSQKFTSINLYDYVEPGTNSKDEQNNENNEKNDKSSDDLPISEYQYFTQEEIQQNNDKIINKYQKYKQMPLRSSDIHIIYRSGIIE